MSVLYGFCKNGELKLACNIVIDYELKVAYDLENIPRNCNKML